MVGHNQVATAHHTKDHTPFVVAAGKAASVQFEGSFLTLWPATDSAVGVLSHCRRGPSVCVLLLKQRRLRERQVEHLPHLDGY